MYGFDEGWGNSIQLLFNPRFTGHWGRLRTYRNLHTVVHGNARRGRGFTNSTTRETSGFWSIWERRQSSNYRELKTIHAELWDENRSIKADMEQRMATLEERVQLRLLEMLLSELKERMAKSNGKDGKMATRANVEMGAGASASLAGPQRHFDGLITTSSTCKLQRFEYFTTNLTINILHNFLQHQHENHHRGRYCQGRVPSMATLTTMRRRFILGLHNKLSVVCKTHGAFSITPNRPHLAPGQAVQHANLPEQIQQPPRSACKPTTRPLAKKMGALCI
ncbi:hypothetical protein DFS34DRAFT_379676 [Phlyctochytrium arcticum]|nr:hypothetical protein DFS34DRAFT_379676 [Phlyctochytrium arcticum]